MARVARLDRGRWDGAGGESGYGLLVFEGVLCRRVFCGGRAGAELVGPGDLVRPGEGIDDLGVDRSELTVVEPARVALLDLAFALRAAPYPEVSVALSRRALGRSAHLAQLLAINGQRRIETRLELLFGQLADRFGTPCGDGEAELSLRLSHRLLGEMVAAHRPSVSAALGQLERQGFLRRAGRRGWIVRPAALPTPVLDGAGTASGLLAAQPPQARAAV